MSTRKRALGSQLVDPITFQALRAHLSWAPALSGFPGFSRCLVEGGTVSPHTGTLEPTIQLCVCSAQRAVTLAGIFETHQLDHTFANLRSACQAAWRCAFCRVRSVVARGTCLCRSRTRVGLEQHNYVDPRSATAARGQHRRVAGRRHPSRFRSAAVVLARRERRTPS